MIDSKQLQLGNYVYWDEEAKKGVAHKVILIGKSHIYTIPISLGRSLDDYSPIPITPQLLSKIEGFEISEGGETSNYKYWATSSLIEVRFREDDYTVFLVGCGVRTIMEHIKFLHQIQNIIFCLSGNELKLNFSKQ